MQRYGFIFKKTKIACLLVFLCHLLISHVALPMLNKADLYPFYSWDLFSSKPLVQNFYFMRIHVVDGKTLTPPHLVFLNRNIYRGRHPRLVPHQIQRLGSYLANTGNKNQILISKSKLEKNILKKISIRGLLANFLLLILRLCK